MPHRSRKVFLALSMVVLLASCQPTYLYHFPKEQELNGVKADSLKWKYSANTVVQVPVANSDGQLFWLDVTPKTKLEIKSTYGEVFRFYLQSIHVENDQDGLLGSSAIWTGYDLLQHSKRSVFAREILTLTVISETGATKSILK